MPRIRRPTCRNRKLLVSRSTVMSRAPYHLQVTPTNLYLIYMCVPDIPYILYTYIYLHLTSLSISLRSYIYSSVHIVTNIILFILCIYYLLYIFIIMYGIYNCYTLLLCMMQCRMQSSCYENFMTYACQLRWRNATCATCMAN